MLIMAAATVAVAVAVVVVVAVAVAHPMSYLALVCVEQPQKHGAVQGGGEETKGTSLDRHD